MRAPLSYSKRGAARSESKIRLNLRPSTLASGTFIKAKRTTVTSLLFPPADKERPKKKFGRIKVRKKKERQRVYENKTRPE